MLNQLLNLIISKLEEKQEVSTSKADRIMEMMEEYDELEIKYIQQLEYVERWGDINDPKDWRTVELTKIKRLMEAKKRAIEALKEL